MENQINELVQALLSKYQAMGARISSFAMIHEHTAKLQQMEELKATLDEIKTIEAELFPIRDRFLSAGGAVSPETQTMIDQSISIVSELIPKLGELESQARIERESMAPKIHNGVRALQMQTAYSSNR